MGMHKGIVGREPTSTDQGPGSLSQKANDIGRRGDQDKTLADYIARKQESDDLFNDDHRFPVKKKKLTFEEWYSQSGWAARGAAMSLDDKDSCKFMMFQAWKASQEQSE